MNRNILITSAGKRCELLLEFQRELKAVFSEAKVYTTDCNPEMAPACRLSDGAFTVSRATASGYIDELLEICRERRVGVVIPTIDTELQVMADNRELFSRIGVEVMVSDVDFIAVCRDKRKTVEYLKKRGIRCPEERDKHNPVFPMFAKPYDGSLSANVHLLRCRDDLTHDILCDPKLMFMEYIDRNEYREFTVDMYYGADSLVKSIVPRERIEIRSGEVNKAAARKNYLIGYLKERLGYLPGVRGCICLQLFYRKRDNDVVGIEINPRFGGGYPLSYYAGAKFPSLIIKEYMLGENILYSDGWEDNTVMLRYDSQVIFHE